KATLKVISSFVVKDHIGALAVNASRIYAANWDADRFYAFDHNGTVLTSRENATRVAYQDLKFVGDDVVASGIMHDQQTGAIDWLDGRTLSLRQRLHVGKTSSGLVWTREGMAVNDGKLYLLPDDGHGTPADVYVFDLHTMMSAALQCVPISA